MAHDGERTETTGTRPPRSSSTSTPPSPSRRDDEGFEQGYDQHRDTPEEELEPNFARGISEEPPEGERHGRFSTGAEETPRHAGEGGRAPLQRGRRASPDERLTLDGPRVTPRARPAATCRC